MASIYIDLPDGTGEWHEIGDYYNDLNPATQDVMRANYRNSIMAQRQPAVSATSAAPSTSGGGNTEGAGWSEDDWRAMVVNGIESYVRQRDGAAAAPTPTDAASTTPTEPPDDSFTGALQHGLFQAAHGIGRTVSALGAPETGASIANAIPDTPNYQTASSGLGDAIKQGRWTDALEYVPRALVEQAPDLAGVAGAGLVGSLAGPFGTAAGVGAYTGVRTLGDNADAVAAQHHHATPTGDDLSTAAVLSAGEGGLAALAGPAVGRAAAGTVGSAAAGGFGLLQDAYRIASGATPVERLVLAMGLHDMVSGDDPDDVRARAQRRATINRILTLAGLSSGE